MSPDEARALVEEVRERHTKDRSRLFLGFVCGHCTGEETGFREGIKWPCDASRLADALSASLAEVERLQEVYETYRKETMEEWARAGREMRASLAREEGLRESATLVANSLDDVACIGWGRSVDPKNWARQNAETLREALASTGAPDGK
jgi:hypothetical protein